MEGVQSDQDVALSGTISKELAPPQKQSKSASPAISKPSPPTMAPQTVLVPDLISAGMSPDTFIRFLEMWKSMDGASQLKAFKSQIAETKDSSLKGELEGLKVYKPAEKKLASDDKDGATGEDAVDGKISTVAPTSTPFANTDVDTTSFIPGFKKPKRIQEMSREKLEQLEAKKAAERAEKQKQLDDEEPIWDISLVNGTRITKYKEYHVIYRNGHQEWVIPDDFSNHVEARALLERLAKVASVNMDERDWMSTSEKRCRGRPRKYPNNAGDRDQNATNANVVDLSRDSS
ncbi:hypothetical protein G7Y89_g12680 [Cudoniella acicularis]|uniref:Uncharacterized protein n=1 Tax=Cudoniella acicularis TaxID=354080 RepID=A0A8H4RBD7_9HELO|nr:hypothetical protein G7Y89_g12680 [Cudoniella acicularis]